jgi:hypothetical protein
MKKVYTIVKTRTSATILTNTSRIVCNILIKIKKNYLENISNIYYFLYFKHKCKCQLYQHSFNYDSLINCNNELINEHT